MILCFFVFFNLLMTGDRQKMIWLNLHETIVSILKIDLHHLI